MWDRARHQYETEREQLRQLVEMYRPYIAQAMSKTPAFMDLGSYGSMLHSFYTGTENILERISIEIDGWRPSGDMWHQQLLDTMTQPSNQRPAVISPDLRALLHEYLRFRHFYRNAYTFLLDWNRMQPLVEEMEPTFRKLEAELDAFFAANAAPDT